MLINLKNGSLIGSPIGGRTSHDTNVTVLDQILTEWGSSGGYLTRVNNLRGTLLQVGTNVFDDGFKDELQGGSGRDWFFADLDGLDGDDDDVKDKKNKEELGLL